MSKVPHDNNFICEFNFFNEKECIFVNGYYDTLMHFSCCEHLYNEKKKPSLSLVTHLVTSKKMGSGSTFIAHTHF